MSNRAFLSIGSKETITDGLNSDFLNSRTFNSSFSLSFSSSASPTPSSLYIRLLSLFLLVGWSLDCSSSPHSLFASTPFIPRIHFPTRLMDSNLDGPIDAIRSRRRASTAGSTGLDYMTSRRIDEDISSRIRSLLLSRQHHYPPRTPHPSDEQPPGGPAESDPFLNFDFSTARSIGKVAREYGRPSLPAAFRRALSKSDQPAGPEWKPAEPPFPSIKASSPSLRSVNSATELKPTNNDPLNDVAKASHVERSALNSPTGSRKKFRIPRLTFIDKKPRDSTEIKTSTEIQQTSRSNDEHIHLPESKYCSPCSPEDSTNLSKYASFYSEWPYRAIKANPADLACFLAGCPPDQMDCKKHGSSRLQSATSRTPSSPNVTAEDLKAVAEKLSRDAAELGIRLSIKGIASGSEQDFTKRHSPWVEGDGAQSSDGSRADNLSPETRDPKFKSNIDILSARGRLPRSTSFISPWSSVKRTKTVRLEPEARGTEPVVLQTQQATTRETPTSISSKPSIVKVKAYSLL